MTQMRERSSLRSGITQHGCAVDFPALLARAYLSGPDGAVDYAGRVPCGSDESVVGAVYFL